MSMQQNIIDRKALKFNQASIVFWVAIAFLFNIPLLIAFVSAVMIIGTIFPGAGLFKLVYKHLIKPLKFLKPEIVTQSNSPHLFAQGMGGIFLGISFMLILLTGLQLAGWIISLLVLTLAFVNIAFNFCAGCFLYFQLSKLGIIKSNNITRSENV